MFNTTHLDYRGWSISVRCGCRNGPDGKMQPDAFEAVAEAELLPHQNPGNWVDPRVQLLNTGNRVFRCPHQCVAELLTEVRELIDALAK